ncbi:hypothetical protein GCM10017783_24950 [Deinococcus piscis]|uniref:UspA domain-containing protein n=1 Tax=Deinococcus piscis TaxID=394230 RepID=A0ABQ3KAW8_9DEIO|nr:universal stress protein [Deinococcus piscis]GHG11620.1 hypothetical protein GCM10017783_24950 [Deinococcus piscis]
MTQIQPNDSPAQTISATKDRILVTTDGSEVGNRAIKHAEQLCNALGAELVILYVQRDPTPPLEEFGRHRVTPADIQRRKAELTAVLGEQYPQARLRLEPRLGESIQKIVVRVREEEQAKMLVMSTHGRGGVRRALLGSVAENIMRQVRVPVLLVKADQPVVQWTKR